MHNKFDIYVVIKSGENEKGQTILV